MVSNITTSNFSMTVAEAILQGLGASIVATSSSSTPASNTAQITTPPISLSSNTTSTLLTGDYSLPFGNHSTVRGSQNPFEPAHWYTEGPDIASAQQCFSALTSFELASADFYTSSIQNSAWPVITSTRTQTYRIPTTTTIYPANPSTYTLCDGSPRVDIKPQTTIVTNITIGQSYTTVVTATPTPLGDRPCNGTAQTCYEWFRYSNLTNDWYTTNTTDSQLMLRECGFPAHFDSASNNATNWPCLISGGPVQLYYFPVDSDPEQELCNESRTSIPHSTTTPPPTIVTNGYTLTSGSVYVSFSTLFAYYDAFGGYHFGTTFSDLLLPFASSEISTHCGGDFPTATQLNYADLNSPIPASAYACQQRCRQFYNSPTAECETIWDDFNPQMQIPTRLTDLHPSWKTCRSFDPGLVNEWLFDPPVALTQHTAEAGATLPGYVPVESPTAETGGGGDGPTFLAGGYGMPTWPTGLGAVPAYDSVGGGGWPEETGSSMVKQGVGSAPTASSGAQVLVAESLTITASPVADVSNAVVVDGHTISQDGPAWTFNGHIISYGFSGLVAIATPSGQEQAFSAISTTASGPSRTSTTRESSTTSGPSITTNSHKKSMGATGMSSTTSTAERTVPRLCVMAVLIAVLAAIAYL